MPNYAVTTRQERFADLISLGTLSDVEAARQAGYSTKGARASAQQNRAHPAVASLIGKKSAMVAKRLKLTREIVLRGLLYEAQNGNTSSARPGHVQRQDSAEPAEGLRHRGREDKLRYCLRRRTQTRLPQVRGIGISWCPV